MGEHLAVVVEFQLTPHQSVSELARIDAERTDVARDLFVLFLWTLAEHDLEHAVAGFGRLAVNQRNKVRRKDEWGFGWRNGREERTRQIDSRTRSFDLAHFEIVHEQC